MSHLHGIRVSKTSFKPWQLYGPVDQALRTSCQAEGVQVKSLKVMVHHEPVDVEMWFNSEQAVTDGSEELNIRAQTILQEAQARELGTTPEKALLEGKGLPAIPVVKGVAILTGSGATDFPTEHDECILATLIGMHEDAP